MKEDYIAIVDVEAPNGTAGGMILGVKVLKGQEPIEAMMRTFESIKAQGFGVVQCVTFVEPCDVPPAEPYMHPQLAAQTAPDGSIKGPRGPMWLKLIIQMSTNGEEE